MLTQLFELFMRYQILPNFVVNLTSHRQLDYYESYFRLIIIDVIHYAGRCNENSVVQIQCGLMSTWTTKQKFVLLIYRLYFIAFYIKITHML